MDRTDLQVGGAIDLHPHVEMLTGGSGVVVSEPIVSLRDPNGSVSPLWWQVGSVQLLRVSVTFCDRFTMATVDAASHKGPTKKNDPSRLPPSPLKRDHKTFWSHPHDPLELGYVVVVVLFVIA